MLKDVGTSDVELTTVTLYLLWNILSLSKLQEIILVSDWLITSNVTYIASSDWLFTSRTSLRVLRKSRSKIAFNK